VGLKLSPNILGWSALLLWLSCIYLHFQYNATRPIMPDPAKGRIYSTNVYGHVAYLTEREVEHVEFLKIGAFSFFIIAALVGYFQRDPRRLRDIRSTAIRALYGISSPTSWWTFAVTARRKLASVSIRSVVTVLFGQKTICLHTKSTISECRARLDRSVGFNTLGPVLGNTSGDKFHLYVVRKDFRNSFAPHCYGKLKAAASGTIIKGKFGMNFLVRIFLSMWFVGLAAIGGSMAIVSQRALIDGQAAENVYVGLFFPCALFLCGLLMVYWGKRIGMDDEAQIVTFLQRTLDARF